MEQISGYRLEEVKQKDWFTTFLPKRDQKRIRALFSLASSGIKTHNNVNPIVTKDGSEHEIEWNDKILKDDNGDVVGLLATGQDITEHKKAEERIREQSEFLRNALESLSYPFYVIDANDYTIKMANTAAAGAEALPEGMTCYALTHRLDKPCAGSEQLCPVEKIKKTKKPAVVEHTHYDKAGSERIYEVHAHPIFDKEGNIPQIIEYSLDITERKRSEEALRHSQKGWENTFNAISDWVVLMDLKGQILRTNCAGEKFVGVPEVQIVGQTCCKLLHGSDTPLPGCPLLKMLQSGHSETMELQLPDSNRWVAASVDPVINEKGTLAGAVHIIRDITERRHAEDERESTIGLLHLLNATNQKHELMKLVTTFLKDWSDCEAIGIRLQEGEDFPYFETSGFPEEFVLAESKLCSVNELGEIERDSQGKPYLECMCRNIISDRFDPSKPFFTEHGSYWTNSTTEMLASSTEADRMARTRNRCNTAGYESVALIPLRAWGETFGLLQFNDKHKGRFTPEKISMFERLADNLAIGLAQRRTEEALRKSEEHLELFFSQSLDGFFFMMLDEPVRWDDTVDKEETLDYVFAHQQVTKVNDAMLLQYGASREQFMGMTPNDLYAHNIACGRDVWRRFFDAGQLHVETDERKLDGTPIWIEGDYICLYDSQGRITGHFGIQRDVTDRKKAEDEVRKSEEHYRMLAETMNDGLGQLDEDGRYIYVNNKFGEMLGYSPDEIVGRHWTNFFDEDAQKIINEQMIERKKGIAKPYELENTRKDGQKIVIRISPQTIFDEDGKYKGSFAIIADITDRKKAEKKIHNLAKFPSENPNFVLRIAKDGKVLYSNEAGSLLLAKWKSKVGGIIPEKWRNVIAEAFKLEKGKTKEEEEVKGKFFSVTIAPVKDAGYINLYANDITERKKLEEQTRKRQAELFHISRLSTVGEMASGLAHELNQPLCAILTYANVCLRTIKPGMTDIDQLTKNLKTIESQTQLAGAIIRRIKNFI